VGNIYPPNPLNAGTVTFKIKSESGVEAVIQVAVSQGASKGAIVSAIVSQVSATPGFTAVAYTNQAAEADAPEYIIVNQGTNVQFGAIDNDGTGLGLQDPLLDYENDTLTMAEAFVLGINTKPVLGSAQNRVDCIVVNSPYTLQVGIPACTFPTLHQALPESSFLGLAHTIFMSNALANGNEAEAGAAFGHEVGHFLADSRQHRNATPENLMYGFQPDGVTQIAESTTYRRRLDYQQRAEIRSYGLANLFLVRRCIQVPEKKL
jgi:hypothetical protein